MALDTIPLTLLVLPSPATASEGPSVLRSTPETSTSIPANPQYPMLLYNLACAESLSGRTAEAIDHLRRAIDGSERHRSDAREDSDFDPIRDEPAFTALLNEENTSSQRA